MAEENKQPQPEPVSGASAGYAPRSQAEKPHEPREYAVGGGWGGAINWNGDDQFSKPFDETKRFSCHGWKRRKPQVGDTLRGEFERSIIWFRFVSVKPCVNPPDMFFAEVVAVRQEKRVGHTDQAHRPGRE